jgi:hypothetical protein
VVTPVDPVPPPPGPSYTAPGRVPPLRSSMTRVEAGPGQSCAQYVGWCTDWCKKNGDSGCIEWCGHEGSRCRSSGEWTIENELKIIINLPPR